MHRLLIGIFVLAVFPAALLGCSDDSDDDDGTVDGTAIVGTPDAVEPDEVLNSLEEVRAMIASAASDLDPEVVEDVNYDDGMLSVTLSDGIDASDAVAMEDTCDDISSALAIPDLQISLQRSDGSVIAECSFSS